VTTYQRCGWRTLEVWPIATLGFLEVSLGAYEAALTTLGPLLRRDQSVPGIGELVASGFVPDAAEALIRTGQLDQAETLVDGFHLYGRRLDRAWTLAVAGRCRAMLLAARGDLDAALRVVEQAMVDHERLSMPFEHARTQLLHGQLQRRSRQKDTAAATLHKALRVFDDLGAPLWAARARAELERVNVSPSRTARLTPSEQRVAELAASGMTNREAAAVLFISPKTVEANLARVYRKLGIRSRAELGQRMANPEVRYRGTPDSPNSLHL
jgi:DNA-binding CsgD family transcriptional regulator